MHHLAFHGEVVAIEPRLQHQIEQQLERLGRRFGRHQHVVVHVVEARGGIAVAAQGLHLQIEFTGLEALAALEHHVFKKVGQTRFIAAFAGAASSAPQIEAHHRSLRQIDLHEIHAIAEGAALRLRQRLLNQTGRRGQRIVRCV